MNDATLNRVLNLVRHEAATLENPLPQDPFPMSPMRARQIIRNAALLVQRAAQISDEILTEISDQNARCHGHRQLGRHCGGCQEYDRQFVCDLDGRKGSAA